MLAKAIKALRSDSLPDPQAFVKNVILQMLEGLDVPTDEIESFDLTDFEDDDFDDDVETAFPGCLDGFESEPNRSVDSLINHILLRWDGAIPVTVRVVDGMIKWRSMGVISMAEIEGRDPFSDDD